MIFCEFLFGGIVFLRLGYRFSAKPKIRRGIVSRPSISLRQRAPFLMSMTNKNVEFCKSVVHFLMSWTDKTVEFRKGVLKKYNLGPTKPSPKIPTPSTTRPPKPKNQLIGVSLPYRYRRRIWRPVFLKIQGPKKTQKTMMPFGVSAWFCKTEKSLQRPPRGIPGQRLWLRNPQSFSSCPPMSSSSWLRICCRPTNSC